MAKTIRPTYPLEFSIGILLVIFLLSAFLSLDIFSVRWHDMRQGNAPFLGMFLAGGAVVVMALILWEEFLFPVHVKPTGDVVVFKNHFTKLKTQILIYCIIPVIVVYIFFAYKVSIVPFLIWAGICLLAPVVGRIVSGIKNYNDFLKLTNDAIEFKNNEHEDVLKVTDIEQITLIRDSGKVLHKIEVVMRDNRKELIDLDEMELEAYYHAIDEFIQSHYGKLVKIGAVSS